MCMFMCYMCNCKCVLGDEHTYQVCLFVCGLTLMFAAVNQKIKY